MDAEVNAYAATSSHEEQRYQYIVLILGVYCGQALPGSRHVAFA